MSYIEQFDILNNKVFITKGIKSRNNVIRSGYFNLVNGYKDFFVKSIENGKRVYYSNISINQLKSLMEFDKSIRRVIFKYVTQIEEEISAIFGYAFEKELSDNNLNWGDMSLYKTVNGNNGRNILSRIYYDISKRNNSYIKHYENKHSYFPSWIMMKSLSFGTLIKLISFTNDKYKKILCNLYGVEYREKDFKKLTSMLSLINALRNNIAHSERIIDFHGNSSNFRNITKYHKALGYKKREIEKFIDAVIYMKYFMPSKEYKAFIGELINEFTILKRKIHNNALMKVLKAMGIRTDMSCRNALESLKESPNLINYSTLI